MLQRFVQLYFSMDIYTGIGGCAIFSSSFSHTTYMCAIEQPSTKTTSQKADYGSWMLICYSFSHPLVPRRSLFATI